MEISPENSSAKLSELKKTARKDAKSTSYQLRHALHPPDIGATFSATYQQFIGLEIVIFREKISERHLIILHVCRRVSPRA
jgi:hypothetical protein